MVSGWHSFKKVPREERVARVPRQQRARATRATYHSRGTFIMKRFRLGSSKVHIDRQLLFITLGLLLFGLIMVADASVVDATRYFGDKFFYAKRQGIWALLGLGAMFICARIDHRIWKEASKPIFLGTVILLVATLLPGVGVSALGAKRWIELGPIVIQPAELAKFSLCVFLARVLFEKRKLVLLLLAVVTVVILTTLEPDLGTAVIIVSIALLMYFASGAPIWHFVSLIPASFIGIGVALLSPYRRDRLQTFFNPSVDPLGSSYHIRQIMLALGSGGIWGLGLGQSRQKYLFLPEPATDSIFAIIGEELGLIGSGLVVFAFGYLVWRGLRTASQARDSYSRLLATGITCWIGVQAFVNLAAMLAIIPLTGVPLPFLSYGGSALIVNLAAVGILLNISKNG